MKVTLIMDIPILKYIFPTILLLTICLFVISFEPAVFVPEYAGCNTPIEYVDVITCSDSLRAFEVIDGMEKESRRYNYECVGFLGLDSLGSGSCVAKLGKYDVYIEVENDKFFSRVSGGWGRFCVDGIQQATLIEESLKMEKKTKSHQVKCNYYYKGEIHKKEIIVVKGTFYWFSK